MKFSVRDLVHIAVFGALWGVVEISVGAYLHVLLPPGATYLPLIGPGIAALGLAISLVGRRFVPRPGSVFMIGVVAALLKLLSIGGIKIGPLLGILIESGIAELVLLALPGSREDERRFSYMLAGGLGVASALPQKFLFSSLILGRSALDTYVGLVHEGARLFGVDARYALALLLFLLLMDLVLGGLAGVLAWQVSRVAETRLATR
jgi:hypothetical protein